MKISRLNNVEKSNNEKNEDVKKLKEKQSESVFADIKNKSGIQSEDEISLLMHELEQYADGYINEQNENKIKKYSEGVAHNSSGIKENDIAEAAFKDELASLYRQLSNAAEKDEQYAIRDSIDELCFQHEFSALENELYSGNLSEEDAKKINAKMAALQNRYISDLRAKNEERYRDELNDMYTELANTTDIDERNELKGAIVQMQFTHDMGVLQEKLENALTPEEKDSVHAEMSALKNTFEYDNSKIAIEGYANHIAGLYQKLVNEEEQASRDMIKAQIDHLNAEFEAEQAKGLINKDLSELYEKLSKETDEHGKEAIKDRIKKLTEELEE